MSSTGDDTAALRDRGDFQEKTESLKTDLQRYADVVVDSLLKLAIGDALVINTEEEGFSTARAVANAALERTRLPVKILVTESGRLVDSIDFDPPMESLFAPVKPTDSVLLRISSGFYGTGAERSGAIAGDEFAEDSFAGLPKDFSGDDLRLLQRFGHLAEPVVTGRRIGSPYLVAPAFQRGNISWFDDNNFNLVKEIENIDNIAGYLDRAGIRALRFTSGNGTDFLVEIPEGVFFLNRHVRLPRRDFISDVDFRRIRCVLDRFSASGRIFGTVRVFGRAVDADLFFDGGVLAEADLECSTGGSQDGKQDLWDAEEAFRRLLSFDPMLREAGYAELSGTGARLYLGGSVLESLLTVPMTDEEIPPFFNTSIYSICVEFPSDTDVSGILQDGESIKIIRGGRFLV